MSSGHTVVRIASPVTVVRESESRTTVVRPAHSTVIQTAGIPGPQGPQGPPGEGSGGGEGAQFYVHTQMVASNVWTVNHNLGYRPAVTVYDTAPDQVFGEITHIDPNSLTITFSDAISGTAYMS